MSLTQNLTDPTQRCQHVTMIISSDAYQITSYNHQPLADACVSAPGRPFTDDDPSFPRLSRDAIRQGKLIAYRPAGAFDVRTIGGRQHVIFYGVPKSPWDPSAPNTAKFADLDRTIYATECPDGTPKSVLKALDADAHERLRRQDAEAAKPKKKAKGKKAKKKHRD